MYSIQIKDKNNKNIIFSTAATLPKPTDVNEVIAKKSAVKYFDFKSGPLKVSLTTEIIIFRSFKKMKLTYDKAFYIFQQDDQAMNISHVNLVFPKLQ